ncbi:serine/threonine-protein kinase TIO-like [Chenopodium quinoa]|uniref:serine/threonine-protein kinase TIO-like n=1 Tax=Chenopodium quinoa TaxID=63459 RepID=UPI000B797D47|nr:serine/threonine-protein kinase TIO-like [Chenopodium quinoa]
MQGNAAFHKDSLYEELMSSFSKLTNLLLLPEEDITKLNAAGALGNLVRHSNLLCEDIVSHGAIQELVTLNCLQEKKEVDFHYGLVRVRENEDFVPKLNYAGFKFRIIYWIILL